MSPAILWLALGVILVLVEVSVAPGIGFLFAGLGSITLAAFMILGLIAAPFIDSQIAYLFCMTAMWWIVLWKPLKNSIKGKKGDSYDNLYGSYGVVESDEGLEVGRIGNVRWSGTRIRARIRPESNVESINRGETVWVYDQIDGILLVDKDQPKTRSKVKNKGE